MHKLVTRLCSLTIMIAMAGYSSSHAQDQFRDRPTNGSRKSPPPNAPPLFQTEKRALPVSTTNPDVAQVLKFFQQMTRNDGVLVGQNMGHANGDVTKEYYKFVEGLHRKTDRWPALLGSDYGYDDIPPFLNSTNRFLEKHAEAGGIVTISMHPKNPWQNSEVGDREIGNFRELLTEGSRPNKNYRRQLDKVAKGLARLRDNNVVVLWRPFHEMNGGWFWWCPEQNGDWPSRNEFKALWMDMFRYFTKVKQLDNLLWVYSAAVQKGTSERSAIEYYPGDKYVDIVGLDWYMDDIDELDSFQSYSQLVSLNKPLGLTEFGPLSKRNGRFDCNKLGEALKKYPEIRFFLFWHSWSDNDVAIVDQKNGPQLMDAPGMMTRDELIEQMKRQVGSL